MSQKNLNRLIYRIAEISSRAGEGHVPSALSILDIVWIIYNDFININLVKKKSEKRDIFILSKGHGCLAQYVVLEEKKFFLKNELSFFSKYNSKFGGHPDSNKIPGIEASTGSLGHGFPFAAGIAYGNKIKKYNNKVYVLIGDGECNEGTIWETCMLAAQHKLNNLICIIDNNKSTSRSLNMINVKNKFNSFGWEVLEVNGHDHNSLKKNIKHHSKKPLAIIANTIKGKGINFMEVNHYEWHHKKIEPDILHKIYNLLELK